MTAQLGRIEKVDVRAVWKNEETYSNDNGRAETTQLITSTTTYSLNYNCIYPPTATNVTFTGLIAPTHTPCTYVGSQPASCTSLVD